jgi:hypothetical protein
MPTAGAVWCQAEGNAGYARERVSDSTAAATKRASALVSDCDCWPVYCAAQ